MIQKRIDAENTLIKTQYFPCALSARSTGKGVGSNKVLLGIGGNIGNVVRRFEHLFWYFKRSSFVYICETAPIVKNPPFGYLEQGYFYNSLILIETHLSPKALLRYLLRVEKVFGRKRLFKDGPRTLDIDIIFYENVKMQSKNLTLPHPGWKIRSSVLIPLKYLSSQGRSFKESLCLKRNNK